MSYPRDRYPGHLGFVPSDNDSNEFKLLVELCNIIDYCVSHSTVEEKKRVLLNIRFRLVNRASINHLVNLIKAELNNPHSSLHRHGDGSSAWKHKFLDWGKPPAAKNKSNVVIALEAYVKKIGELGSCINQYRSF